MKWIFATFVLLFPTFAFAGPALNPAVTQETINQTICVHGYTRTVRPPVRVTNLIKKRLLKANGLSPSAARRFELDHWMPLALGGDPGAIDRTDNLVLQTWPEAKRKDKVEYKAYRCVCDGKVSLAEAQHDMYENWHHALIKYRHMKCD